MASKKFIAANWKMHPAPVPHPTLDVYAPSDKVDVVVFPTFLDIQMCLDAGLRVGAQYGHPDDSGAHTGDVSMKMLADLGCTYVLCGHSERRLNHGETDEDIAAQVVSALSHNLTPILCIGENEEDRTQGKEKEVVQRQLQTVLTTLENYPLPTTNYPLIIAYEPVWAIGTGKTATPDDAQNMHSFIRFKLTNYNLPTTHYKLIYGGSMKPENARALLSQPDIDGGLVGGASLDPVVFGEIIKEAGKV